MLRVAVGRELGSENTQPFVSQRHEAILIYCTRGLRQFTTLKQSIVDEMAFEIAAFMNWL